MKLGGDDCIAIGGKSTTGRSNCTTSSRRINLYAQSSLGSESGTITLKCLYTSHSLDTYVVKTSAVFEKPDLLH